MTRPNDGNRPAASPPPPPRSRVAGGPPPLPPPLPSVATKPDVVLPPPTIEDEPKPATPVVEKKRSLAGFGPIIATAVVAVVVVLGTAIVAGRILLNRPSPGVSPPDVQARDDDDDEEPQSADFAGRDAPDAVSEGMNRAVGRGQPRQSRRPTPAPQNTDPSEEPLSQTILQDRIPSRK